MIDQIDKQQDAQAIQPHQILDFPVETQQEKMQSYRSFLNVSSQLDVQQFLEKLPSDIDYYQQLGFAENIQIKVKKASKNCQLMELQARLGFYRFRKICIVVMDGVSPNHKLDRRENGNFCNVYFCRHGQKDLAFKCFQKAKLSSSFQQTNLLSNIIEEYCILKLASLRAIGPKTLDLFGYNIIVYSHCIEFYMETCQPFLKDKKTINKISLQLKQNLVKLHSLQIVHHDIKVQNIAFSQAFNRFVFIDFGMGRILKQKLGFKSLTSFKGSLNYCSQQMASLSQPDSLIEKNVDLYFNDFHALKVTLQNITRKEYQEDASLMYRQRLFQKNVSLDIIYQEKFMKYCLFSRKSLQAFNILNPDRFNNLFSLINNQKKILNVEDFHKVFVQIARLKFGYFLEDWNNHDEVQEKKNQSLQMQTLSQLNQANLHCRVTYFLNRFPPNPHQLCSFLKDLESIDILGIEGFNCLLAKAIQINGSDLALKQLQQLCQCACERNPQLYSLKGGLTKYSDASIKHFSLVSEYLFRKALAQKLRGKYFEVYLFIVNNVILYEIFTIQQILQFYQILFDLELIFEQRVTAFIRFYFALTWLYLNTFNFSKYKILSTAIHQNTYLLMSKLYQFCNKQEIQILQKILMVYYYNNQLNDEEQKFVRGESLVEIKIWTICKKIDQIMITEGYLEVLQKEVQNAQVSFFQYHHLYLMLAYAFTKKMGILADLIQKFKKVMRNKIDSPFLIFIESLYSYRQSNDFNFDKLMNSISRIANIEHPFFNFRIQRLIQFHCFSNQENGNKIDFLKKKYYYQLRITNGSRSATILRYPSLSNRYYKQIRLIYILNPAQSDYQQQIDKEAIFEDMFTDRYFELRGQLLMYIEYKQGNIHQINQLLAISLFFLAMILVSKKKFIDAAKICRYLIKILSIKNYQKLNKNLIVFYLFAYIITNDLRFRPQAMSQYKVLYFELLEEIQNNNKEQFYFQKHFIFSQLLELMFEQCPHKLPSIINKTLKKTQIFNNKLIAQSLMLTFEMLFGKNHEKKHFVRECLALEDKIEASPYSCFLLFHIFRLKDFKKLTERDYLRVFLPLSRANIIVRERVLRNLLIFYLSFAKDRFSLRKRMGLSRKVIRYDWVAFTVKHLSKLLMSDQSRRRLKVAVHLRKHQTILQKLGRFLQCVQLSATDHVKGAVVNRQIILV